jgi:hypothetical protein
VIPGGELVLAIRLHVFPRPHWVYLHEGVIALTGELAAVNPDGLRLPVTGDEVDGFLRIREEVIPVMPEDTFLPASVMLRAGFATVGTVHSSIIHHLSETGPGQYDYWRGQSIFIIKA